MRPTDARSMSQHSLLHGWRARAHFLSRDRGFLLRTAFGIVAGAFMLSFFIVHFSGKERRPLTASEYVNAAHQSVHEDFHTLRHATTPTPQALISWLLNLVEESRYLSSKLPPGDQILLFKETGLLAGYDAREVIAKHLPDKNIAHDFIIAALLPDQAEGTQALARLTAVCAQKTAPPHACELLAHLHLQKNDDVTALTWLVREGYAYPEAKAARSEAVRTAVQLSDIDNLRFMASEPGWVESGDPLVQHRVGVLLQDVWLLWGGLYRNRIANVPWGVLILAIFSAGLWFFILIQHANRDRWTWLRPILPMFAGMAAVWLTLAILAWQEQVKGIHAGLPFPEDLLWHYMLGIGLREELSKLAVFSLFLPWLLMRRTPGLPFLTGAFVGLGFALEENIQYYQDYGHMVAWSRFISANFLHIALAGLTGQSLYMLFRTRFGHAEYFLGTLAFAVVMHGGYDWLGRSDVLDVGNWLSIAVLLMVASRFIDTLAEETQATRRVISPRAIFTLGSAVMIAITFVTIAVILPDPNMLAMVGQNCLGIVPVAMLYWKKFENA